MREQMRVLGISTVLTIVLLVLTAVPSLFASGSASKQDPQSAKAKKNDSNRVTQQSAGERKFNQNCSRCHKSPESFPPSVSGTILKHMRVRASLSEQDERDILNFLNP